MEKLVIFYDDRKNSCINCAEKFGQYENVECRKISDYQDQSLVYTTGARVGLIFESENGKLPYGVSHIIWKIVADKNRNLLLTRIHQRNSIYHGHVFFFNHVSSRAVK